MNKGIDLIRDATIFLVLDANSRYRQFEIGNEDRDKTSFTSNHGRSHFNCMRWGLEDALGTFQRAMHVLSTKVKWQSSLIYLEDMVIFSNMPSEQIDPVSQVLTSLPDTGVTLNLKKCQISKNETDFFAHIMRPGRHKVSTRPIDAIKELKYTTIVTELRAFLGLCSVFSRFVPNLQVWARCRIGFLEVNRGPLTYYPTIE